MGKSGILYMMRNEVNFQTGVLDRVPQLTYIHESNIIIVFEKNGQNWLPTCDSQDWSGSYITHQFLVGICIHPFGALPFCPCLPLKPSLENLSTHLLPKFLH